MQSLPQKKRETGALKEVWKAYNLLIDYCRAIAVTPTNRGVRIARTMNGTQLSAEIPRFQTESGIGVFRYKSMQDEYLVCRSWDWENEGETDVLIAKPYNMRVSSWNGQSISYTRESSLGGGTVVVTYTKVTAAHRTAVGGGITEQQAIREPYLGNISVIFAEKCDTGVDDCDWLDTNADGRAFAKIA